MGFLSRIFGKARGGAEWCPAGVAGRRAYAVGDVHGRRDLLDDMLARIEEDLRARPTADPVVVFLGDYIDRGPDSAGVIERLCDYAPTGGSAVFLTGNHEEALLRLLDGERGILGHWLRFGGIECAASYGIAEDQLRQVGDSAAAQLLGEHMPRHHFRFLHRLQETFRFGDYLFVHAGIRPGVALDRQKAEDTRWIRQPFLDHGEPLGVMVVHGHTVTEAVEERVHRIGIDTGAYRTGVLTALVIDGAERRYLVAHG